MPHPRKLLVEGAKDKRVIPELLEKMGIPWDDPVNKYLVDIKPLDGKIEKLSKEDISTELKEPGREALGLIFDADKSISSTWLALRAKIHYFDPSIDMPEVIPAEGWIGDWQNVRFGVWLMPDNQRQGMIETLLLDIAEAENPNLLQFATEYCDNSLDHGATFNVLYHRDKARIYAWLAVQDEPGEQLHVALKSKILNPGTKSCEDFKRWFSKLFQIG